MITHATSQSVFDAVKHPLVELCGWCPGAEQEMARLVSLGHRVTTGICPVCSEKMEAELDADRGI